MTNSNYEVVVASSSSSRVVEVEVFAAYHYHCFQFGNIIEQFIDIHIIQSWVFFYHFFIVNIRIVINPIFKLMSVIFEIPVDIQKNSLTILFIYSYSYTY